MKYLLKILILIGISMSILSSNAASNTTVTARLDSVAILMGKQTKLHYQIVQDKGADGYFKSDNPKLAAPNVEIIDEESDTTDLGNNRIQIDRTLIIQSFDSGIWEIPEAKYVIGKDTILSNRLDLKVVPVNVDTLATVHDYKSVSDVPFNLFDFIPDFIYYYWWIILLVLAIAGGAIYLYIRKKNGKSIIPVKKKDVPPYEEAIEALSRLKDAKLWQQGQEKEYFTQLTDILRRYIDRRFGINAIEMTTSQIIETLKRNEETKFVNEHLKQILACADYVKFANMRPLPDDCESSWNKAQIFIEETKPVVVVENPDETTGNDSDKVTKPIENKDK